MLLLGAACVCVCAGVCVYPSDYSKSDEEGPALILGYTVTLMVRNLLYKYICLCTYIYYYVGLRLQILYNHMLYIILFINSAMVEVNDQGFCIFKQRQTHPTDI